MIEILKYFLAEVELFKNDEIASQKDDENVDTDPNFLFKQDLQEMIDVKVNEENSLAFVFGNRKPKTREDHGLILNVTGKLNDSQKEAIRFGLKSDMVAVSGPPGNGKSEMITGLLINAIIRNQKVLIVSHNNKAVDSVTEKIERIKIPELFIRTGNKKYKKNIAEYFQKINLEKFSYVWFWMLVSHIFSSPKNHLKYAKAKACSIIEKKSKYIPKMRQWAEDQKTHTATKAMLDICYGWGLTNLSIKSNFKLDSGTFDLLIVDEAAQCLVGPLLPLMYRAKRIVAVGDQHQLKPIIQKREEREDLILKSNLNAKEKELLFFSESFFDLVVHVSEKEPILLNEHYRCHPEIIEFNNRFFYDGKLKIKTENKKGECLGMFWFDSVLGDYKFTNHNNEKEVEDVCCIVRNLHDEFGISYDDIGVITPFGKQEKELSKSLKKISGDIVCGTIYKFQGSEKKIIILSLCLHDKMREGTKNWVDMERSMINVATSRAKNGLIVVGDMKEANARTGYIKSLYEYYKGLKK